MASSNTIAELNLRYFDYLKMHFSKTFAHYALSVRRHPENNEDSIFFSYRTISHYFNFVDPSNEVFFVFRTRTNNGIAREFEERHKKALSKLSIDRRSQYDLSFGVSSFSEKQIELVEGTKGVETIAVTPFHLSNSINSLESSAFPLIFPLFLQPSNDIAHKIKTLI